MEQEEFERIQREEAEREREKKEKMYEETDKILNDRLPGWDKEPSKECPRCHGTGYVGTFFLQECPICTTLQFFR